MDLAGVEPASEDWASGESTCVAGGQLTGEEGCTG